MNWRIFFLALGVTLWCGLNIGPALVVAGLVEAVVGTLADKYEARKLAAMLGIK